MQELHSTIQAAVRTMRASDEPITAVVSGSELFSRFITLGKFDDKTMDECRQIMLHRGQVFLRKLLESRKKIATRATQFVTDGCVSMLNNFNFITNNVVYKFYKILCDILKMITN